MDEILKEAYANKSQMSTKISSSDNPQLSETSGLGKPDCPHCDGFGYVIPDVPPIHPNFGRAVMCSCREIGESEKRFQNLLKLSEIGQLKNLTFDNFTVDVKGMPGFNAITQASLKKAYDASLAFALEPDGWLILKGGYGCGKTHLAAAIANSQINLGKPVLFINTPDLMDYLRASFNRNIEENFDKRFEQVRNVSLLILDDLGTQYNTGWTQEKLYQIFNYRYTARLPTVITTNQEFESIEPRIRSRLVDRNLAKVITIFAPDYRRPKDQIFSDFSSLHLHQEKQLGNFSLRERELPRNSVSNLKRVFEAALEYAQHPDGWIVFNSVAFGNGKTHLAAAIANNLADSGEQVLFVVVPDLLDYLRDAFDPASHVGLGKRFNEVKKVPILVLDDLGTESATPWAREKLYQLMNYRYSARLPTVITTSKPVLEIDERLRTRMMDESVCDFWTLVVPSYTGAKKPKRRLNR